MTRYVVGFLFNAALTQVTLIEKQRPAWQAGNWNGVGGKCEVNEGCWYAMSREFEEETGVHIGPPGWRRFAMLRGPDFLLYALSAISDESQEKAQSKTDEVIATFNINEILASTNVIPNVRWLIPMALSFHHGERAAEFVVTEVHD